MSNIFDLLSSTNPLTALLGESRDNHVGYVFSMNFREALVLTNDAWKERVNGIPHNSFLTAAAFDPQHVAKANLLEQEVVLLRVLGPCPLPTDNDILRTRIEHNQRRTEEEVFPQDERDGLDPMTHGELQYGALKCRILGTFYVENGQLKLGSDLENYFSSTKLRVFKPRGESLGLIVNHVNADTKRKAAEEAAKQGFKALPPSLEIGTVRYTSTDRLHRGETEAKVPVSIQPLDFLARRTAVFGMTRTGKSNTVKSTVAAVSLAAANGGLPVGQIIFDINGEYANATQQDDGSSIAAVFGEDCVRYRAVDTPGFEDLRTNFYEEPAQGLHLIQELFKAEDAKSYTGQDLDAVMGATLEEPDPQTDRGAHTRWKVLASVWRCILAAAGYAQPQNYQVEIPLSKGVVKQICDFATAQGATVDVPTSTYVTVEVASGWFATIRAYNLLIQEDQRENRRPIVGIESSTKGKPWVDPVLEAFLNFLTRTTNKGQTFGGFKAISAYTKYHSVKRSGDVVNEILAHLLKGRIVILDLSVGPVSVRTVLSKKIASKIFDSSMETVNAGRLPPNIVVYVEEAHNLIDKKADLKDTWPRLAKEGAKAKIAFVYATQEPSSIHPNILSNTENWFVTHLNNDDELRALSKFYDFADFQDSLKSAQDVGFARIKSLSSPFIVPTQIKRFTPDELKVELARIKSSREAGG